MRFRIFFFLRVPTYMPRSTGVETSAICLTENAQEKVYSARINAYFKDKGILEEFRIFKHILWHISLFRVFLMHKYVLFFSIFNAYKSGLQCYHLILNFVHSILTSLLFILLKTAMFLLRISVVRRYIILLYTRTRIYSLILLYII